MKLIPALAAAFMMFAVKAQAAETVIKLAYTTPPDSAMGVGAQTFASELQKALPGKYRVEQNHSSKLGGDADVLKGMKLGTIEMSLLAGGGAVSTVVPEMSVTDLPFLFRDLAHAQAVLDGPVGGDILTAFSKYGLVGLAWGEQGMRQITNSKHPVRTLDDMKGLKMRTPQSPVYVATFKALGADTQAMPWPEVFSALQNGRIDGQENPTMTAVSAKLYEVQKYLTLSSHIYSAGVFVVSADFWAEVSPADRPAFIAAAKAGGKAMREFVQKSEKDAQATMRTKGVEIAELADRAAFVKAVQPIYDSVDPALAPYVKRIRDTK